MNRSTALLGTVAVGLLGRTGAAETLLPVVAAENVWGSILRQLGGTHVTVTSLLTDPNADPHDFEASAATARLFAQARYVILNGAGYDAWSQHLVDADPSNDRTVMTVADVVGRAPGANAHFWYDPACVERVADRITADLARIDPTSAPYYRARRAAFRRALEPYYARIRKIRVAYGGVAVGATESVFAYLAAALGLRLISPPAFMQAVNNGTEPPVSAVVDMDRQLAERRIRLLAYNVQTVTAVTTEARRIAERHAIPVIGISETIVPPSATFQAWQSAQLDAIWAALAR
jgi:zinc/manganese transport system substrate-binding protein